MDDLAALDVLWPRRTPRYRVAITIIDAHEQRASIALYDTNTIEFSRGPQERDPVSGQMRADVRLHMPAALRLSDEGP